MEERTLPSPAAGLNEHAITTDAHPCGAHVRDSDAHTRAHTKGQREHMLLRPFLLVVCGLPAGSAWWWSSDGCDIERRSDLSVEEFRSKYEDRQPVILTAAASRWGAVRTWSRQQLLHRHGALSVEVGEPDLLPDEISQVAVTRTLPLNEFVQVMDRRRARKTPRPLMAFDTVEFAKRANFQAEMLPTIPQFAHWNKTVQYFTWGPPELGLPLHSHSAAFTTTVFGSKQWIFSNASTSKEDIKQMNLYFTKLLGDVNQGRVRGFDTRDLSSWPAPERGHPRLMRDFNTNAQTARRLRCATTIAGDVIYVPDKWWHAVVNLEETVAIVSQKNDKWAKPADELWFRARKLHKQNRHAELLELLEGYARIVTSKTDNPIDFERLRLSMQNELYAMLKAAIQKMACDEGLEIARKLQQLHEADHESMQGVDGWILDRKELAVLLSNVSRCFSIKGDLGAAVDAATAAIDIDEAQKSPRDVLALAIRLRDWTRKGMDLAQAWDMVREESHQDF